MGIAGPSGSGKTKTSLKIAEHLPPVNPAHEKPQIAFVDTERGSASKYANAHEFNVVELNSYHPNTCIEAIHAAEESDHDVVIVDSLSHFWFGKEGELEQVDKVAKRSQSGNSFSAWKEVTPMHNALVDAILGSRCHVIITLRVKTEWVIEENDRGKKVPRKIGTQPIMRDGIEFEMDVFGDMNQSNELVITKTRCEALNEGIYKKPGRDVADILTAWLTDGAPEVKPWEAKFAELEKALGHDAYIALLGQSGYTTAAEIPNKDTAISIYRVMAAKAAEGSNAA
jgi:hypothetical protein